MVNIVTGKINSGKTTFCLANYLDDLKGDGIISLKTMKGKNVQKFDALMLTSQIEKPLLIHQDFLTTPREDDIIIGPYHLLKSTLEWVTKNIEEMIFDQIQPIYLDEIGMLELNDGGFSSILQKMLDSKLEIYFTARIDLVPKIIEKYHITEYKIIEITGEDSIV